MRRKILGVILVICVVATFVPRAWATTIVDSGKCGNGVKWTLDSDGTLIINGEGKMEEWYSESQVPWYTFRDSIENVMIEYGIENIGKRAFQDHISLKNIEMPDSINAISDYAFYGCNTLSNVKIPCSVSSLGEYTFGNCSNLNDITLYDSIKQIGYGAFYNTAFYNDETNWNNGALYVGNCLIRVNNDNVAYDFQPKKNIAVIASGAFEGCTFLKSINIPETMTVIGNKTFCGCTNLINVDIPIGVTTIGNSAFQGCSKLQNIELPNGLTTIGNYALYGCENFTAMYIPDSVTSAGDFNTFSQCTNLEHIELSYNMDKIGYAMFADTKIKSINIPSSISSIGWFAFDDCNFLTDIYYGGSQNEWESILLRNNEALNDVTVHYDCVLKHPTRINGNPKYHSDSNTIVINISNAEDNSNLITVSSLDGEITGIKTVPLSHDDTQKNVNLNDDVGNIIQIFIWDSLQGMRPLCEPKIISIK